MVRTADMDKLSVPTSLKPSLPKSLHEPSVPTPLDEPSAQLHLETRDAVVRALATRRPLLHHLNADTSWLLQIPRPANAVKHGGRVYYNVLIDPWFVGGQSDVARWFSQQWHATPSAVQSVADVEALVRQVEMLAGGMLSRGAADETLIDAVAVSHEFTDHCHKDTLLEVHSDVPVFATDVGTALLSPDSANPHRKPPSSSPRGRTSAP